jgi:hypothetical protein
LIAALSAAVIAVVFGAVASLTDVHRLMDGRKARFGCVFYFGWLLIVAPVVLVLMSDYLADRSGATGELRAAAPWMGFTLAFFTLIPSIVLMIIGALLSRTRAATGKTESSSSTTTSDSKPIQSTRRLAKPVDTEAQRSTVFNLKQQGLVAPSFEVLEDGRRIGRLCRSRDKAVWQLNLGEDGTSHEFYRKRIKGKRLSHSEYLIESGGEVIARAHRPEEGKYSLEIECEGSVLGLRNAGRSGNRWKFTMETHDREIGRILPKSWLTLTCEVQMKESFPVPIVVFAAWIVMEQWRHGVARVKDA